MVCLQLGPREEVKGQCPQNLQEKSAESHHGIVRKVLRKVPSKITKVKQVCREYYELHAPKSETMLHKD